MQVGKPLSQQAVEAALTSVGTRRVLSACIRRPMSARDIADSTRIAMASVYRHIHALQEGGLLLIERSAITPDGKPYDLYRSRVRSATLAVRADEVSVTWELNLAVEERLADMWRMLGGRG